MLASSTVTTVTPVKLLRLKHQAFEDLLNNNSAVAGTLLRHLRIMLAERLRTSLAAENIPITSAEVERPRKKGGLLWTLFGASGG
jgi:CRP-like cAMP-binding protein